MSTESYSRSLTVPHYVETKVINYAVVSTLAFFVCFDFSTAGISTFSFTAFPLEAKWLFSTRKETSRLPRIAHNGAPMLKKFTPDIPIVKAKKAPIWNLVSEKAVFSELIRTPSMAKPAITVTITLGIAITNGTTNAAKSPKMEKKNPFATEAAYLLSFLPTSFAEQIAVIGPAILIACAPNKEATRPTADPLTAIALFGGL